MNSVSLACSAFNDKGEDITCSCSKSIERKKFLGTYETWQKGLQREIIPVLDDQGQFV